MESVLRLWSHDASDVKKDIQRLVVGIEIDAKFGDGFHRGEIALAMFAWKALDLLADGYVNRVDGIMLIDDLDELYGELVRIASHTSLISCFTKAWPMPELAPVTTAVGILDCMGN